MRNTLIFGLLAATTLSACATRRAELRSDRQHVREQRQDVQDAKRYGDRRDVREQREDLRDAKEELREDRTEPR